MVFQFHIGAIRSFRKALFLLQLSIYFNSILVQLEVTADAADYTPALHFNSILVQLEELMQKTGVTLMTNFNSILVQLEEGCILPRCIAWENFNSILVQLEASGSYPYDERVEAFQFHIGAIRSLYKVNHCQVIGDKFQFHIGAIRRSIACADSWLATGISIPYWCN